MNKKFVYKVGNNKKSYTMMHGQPNINIKYMSWFYLEIFLILIKFSKMFSLLNLIFMDPCIIA